MAQNMTAAASLGAPRRHRDNNHDDVAGVGGGGVIAANVGSSMSARFGETEWEAREV